MSEVLRPIDTSVGKALALLDAFRQGPGSAHLSDLARAAGVPKSTAHRLLAILCETGFVARQGHVYYLPSQILELGAWALGGDARDLREVALPYLTDLQSVTGQTVHLAVLTDGDVMYLEKLHGHSAVEVPSRVGSRVPAHACALGKALLAQSPPSVVSALLARPLPRLTPRTVTQPGRLAALLQRAREDGVAFDLEEVAVGVSCIAAPVIDGHGGAIAAVSICGRSTSLRHPGMAPAVVRTARLIGARWREHVDSLDATRGFVRDHVSDIPVPSHA